MPYPSFHEPYGAAFIELQTIDSTNNYALSRIHAGLAQHGMAVLAHEQTEGKGQRGKKWTSPAGANIALSIVIKPVPISISRQFQLSAAVAVALTGFFKQYAGEDTRIKWPNDIYWKDRKAGGILIENVVSINGEQSSVDSGQAAVGSWQWAVIGIGLNINQVAFPGYLPNPVSLKQITSKSFSVVDLAKEIHLTVLSYFDKLIAGEFEEIYAEYLSRLYKKNETVKLKKGTRSFKAIIKTVSPSGKLIVQHSIEEEFDFGEIEFSKQ